MEPVVIEGRHILILWAPGGPARPYKAWTKLGSKTANEWGYFIRKGSSSVRAKGNDEHELLGLANTIPIGGNISLPWKKSTGRGPTQDSGKDVL
jgi:hypothetical protein